MLTSDFTRMWTHLCGYPLTHTGLHTGTHSQTNTYEKYIYIASLIAIKRK